MNKKIKMTAVVHPFSSKQKRVEFDEGKTIQDMVTFVQPDTLKLRNAVVFINGKVIPKEIWDEHKPKKGELVEVRACPIPHGGGGGKDITRLVLTIAVVALSMATGGAALGLMGFSEAAIAAGGAWVTFAGAMYVGAAATIGMLAVNALCPVAVSSMDSLSGTTTQDSNTLYIEGSSNSIDPFGVVPVVLGKFRQPPRQGSKPYTEMIGDDQYIRMLFVWGVGPIEIDEDSMKIGDTLLSEFSDYQIEHREGYVTDEVLTLFPNAINEEAFTVALTAASDWITRTTTINADEIGLDISFAGGLVEYDASGNKQPRAVDVEIQYRETDSGDSWSSIDTTGDKFQATCDASWFNKTGDLLDSITFNGKKTSALRFGIRWGVSERTQYDVRVRRTTADTESTLISDLTYWTALRSIKIESPLNPPYPLAVTALVIKATDQLNGIIDNFSGEVTRVCPDWDSSTETWITRATQNPASLFRFILQGNGMAIPLEDSRIDLEALQDWHEFCTDKGFQFNQVRDYSASVWDTLRDVSAAGRAAPTMIDGKWSVVIDREQDSPVSVITPRNSFNFSSEKLFIDPPHGWRIRFSNEDEGYATDERRVYMDGYSDENATKFETLELLGVTDSDQIYKLGRWRIAQVLNQPERWTFKQDMEFLTYQRGNWIKIAHDVMIVGLAQGRVKEVTTDVSNNVISIELDEEVIMEAGKDYGVVIRTLENPGLSSQIVTEEGTTNTLTFSDAIPGIGSPAEGAISVGDIVCFGEFEEETEDATVIAIIPDNNLQATIIAVPYRPAIYDCDSEEIPEFTTVITESSEIPVPNVTSIVSDETAMIISSTGSLKIRIGINFDPLNINIFGTGNELIVQIRQHGTDENFYPAVIEEAGSGYVFLGDIRTSEVVDIRLRWKINGRLLPGPWYTLSSYTVVGRSQTPSALVNMTISAFGAQALIRWDKPSEIDVLYGGEVEFRHSPLMTSATWGGSVSIGQAAMARTLFAVLPLKEGTYLARVYDVDGNPSETISTVTTKQVSVNSFSSVDTMDEAPDFLGDHNDTEESAGALKLIDGSPAVLSGDYQFATGIDLSSVKNVRITTRLTVSIYNVNDDIDDRLSKLDTWEDFDGSIVGGADARIYIRHTDDNPAGSPVSWSSWERLDSAEFNARAYECYVALERESEDYNILISELGIDIDELA